MRRGHGEEACALTRGDLITRRAHTVTLRVSEG